MYPADKTKQQIEAKDAKYAVTITRTDDGVTLQISLNGWAGFIRENLTEREADLVLNAFYCGIQSVTVL